jgi:predicted transcriptional regulator
MYSSHSVLLKQLEMSTEVTPKDIQMMSNLDQKEFSKVMHQMVKYGFVEYGTKVTPTMRFRTAMTLVDKEPFMKKIGE